MTPIESLAHRIATEAHAGQTDQAGRPYVEHVGRVVARLEDPLDRAVAWLHDVLEDTDVRLVDLRIADRALLDAEKRVSLATYNDWLSVCDAVLLLTHRPHEPRDDYYTRIRTSPRAVRVKLADVADNSAPERLAKLDEATRVRLTEKYRVAREALGGEQG